MALLERLKERFETDISDAELQRVIDEANSEVAERYGPHSDPAMPVTVTLRGGYPALYLDRPAAAIESIMDGTNVLTPDDYALTQGGRLLTRVTSGGVWQRSVTVTYTPVNDGNQRQEVILKLAILDLQYRGLSSERAGDYNASYADYAAERRRILGTLAGKGLGIT